MLCNYALCEAGAHTLRGKIRWRFPGCRAFSPVSRSNDAASWHKMRHKFFPARFQHDARTLLLLTSVYACVCVSVYGRCFWCAVAGLPHCIRNRNGVWIASCVSVRTLQTAHPFLAITEQTERAHTNVQVLLNPLMCLNGYHHFVKFI